MTKLTKRVIEGAENRDKPYFIFDEHLPGFCARIAPNGRRHYYAQYLRGKKTKRMPLGQHGIITTEQARDKAIAVMASVNDGNDPQAEKSQKRKEPTVADLAQRYMEEHVHVHCKPRTATGYQYNLNKRILPQLGGLRISEVTRKDIANFHHTFRDVPYEANRCLEMLSKMFNLAEMWGLRPDGTNPRRHIKKYPEKKRERYLSEAEMRRLGDVLDACEQDGSEHLSVINALRLLIMTGCRLGEIMTLKWDYIDYDEGCFRLPDSKTGAKTVYVGAAVTDLLQKIYEHPETPHPNPYVIYGTIALERWNDIQHQWRRIRSRAGIDDVRIHDLRHSFASMAVSSGQSLAMIGKLLGHTQVQTTARYAHLMSDTVKLAATDISSQIAAKLGNAQNMAENHSAA